MASINEESQSKCLHPIHFFGNKNILLLKNYWLLGTYNEEILISNFESWCQISTTYITVQYYKSPSATWSSSCIEQQQQCELRIVISSQNSTIEKSRFSLLTMRIYRKIKGFLWFLFPLQTKEPNMSLLWHFLVFIDLIEQQKQHQQ